MLAALVAKQYLLEMDALSKGNPEVTGEINLVWCLSGRTTVIGNHSTSDQKLIDSRIKETGGKETADKNVIDPTDDIERLRLAIKIAAKANCKVVYNGTIGENEDLYKFLDFCNHCENNGQLKDNKIFEYLSSNYEPNEVYAIIKEFKDASENITIIYGQTAEDSKDKVKEGDDIVNSLHQVRSFSAYIKKHPDIKQAACVSSAFHLPRVARSITKNQEVLFKNMQFQLHGIDLEYKKPGTKEFDMKSEPVAIKNYSENGSISFMAGSGVKWSAQKSLNKT